MRLIPVGPDAVLVEVDGAGAAADLGGWARSRVDAREIVPAATTVLFDGIADPAGLEARLASWRAGARTDGPRVEVDVTFDGPDLADVAAGAGLSVDAVVEQLVGAELTVAFCGFAPGFAYLVGLPARLHLPRRSTPRSQVPAGSVAIAGGYAGIYPTASPGGWHLIGRTDVVLWDAGRDDPALLPPGARVRFRDASSLGSSTQGFRRG